MLKQFRNTKKLNRELLSYKWNKKKTTHELFLNIDNLTNNQARLRKYYDIEEPNGVAYERHVGLIPIFLYRIYF